MSAINQDSLATLEFQLNWRSEETRHTELYFARKVNFWRDLLPEEMRQVLVRRHSGEYVRLSLPCSKVVQPCDPNEIFTLDTRYFDRRKTNGCWIEPRCGRFYPKGFLKTIHNIFSVNMEPFRVIGVEPHSLTVDFNHPLAGKNFELKVIVHNVREKKLELGGECSDWMRTITNGPGMQVRWQGRPTDFFSDNPFSRRDERADVLFYDQPRLVTHIDGQAIENIKALYGSLLKPGMRVLDLMSSWKSHIPESLHLESLTGLGLNREEMENNPQLTEYVIHDLNKYPQLPFNDQEFDAVICTVSVEYMIRPFDVFLDVARILKPRGYFVHTFSNRWFPPKVINVWTNLHEFERMGLVLEYFLRSGVYENLKTCSVRGWPRPMGDRYYPRVRIADPVYAVWGQIKRVDFGKVHLVKG